MKLKANPRIIEPKLKSVYPDPGIMLRLKTWPYSFIASYEYDQDCRCKVLYITDKITNRRYFYKHPSQRKYQRALFRAVMSKEIWIQDYLRGRMEEE